MDDARDLRFALLAVSEGLLDTDRLAAAARDWPAGAPFLDFLADRGWVTDEQRRRLEQALANLRTARPDSVVFLYHQSNYDAIPDSPWVYWVTSHIRELFRILPALEEIASPKHGATTSDNFRFLRMYWEVNSDRIKFNSRSLEDARKSSFRS